MKQIPLTQGLFAIVDDDDFDWLMQFKWTTLNHPSGPCAYRQSFDRNVYMHRQIVNAQKGYFVDHKDRNRLNNLRSNLRICSPTQNVGNSRIGSSNKSGFKGVRFSKGAWEANITRDYRACYLGRFKDPKEAATAYDVAAIEYFGEFG